MEKTGAQAAAPRSWIHVFTIAPWRSGTTAAPAPAPWCYHGLGKEGWMGRRGRAARASHRLGPWSPCSWLRPSPPAPEAPRALCLESLSRAQSRPQSVSGLPGTVRSSAPLGVTARWSSATSTPSVRSLVRSPSSFRVFDEAERLVTTVTTQSDGQFRVALKPGTYCLDAGHTQVFIAGLVVVGAVGRPAPTGRCSPARAVHGSQPRLLSSTAASGLRAPTTSSCSKPRGSRLGF